MALIILLSVTGVLGMVAFAWTVNYFNRLERL